MTRPEAVSGVWQVVKPLRPHPLAVGEARTFCVARLSSVLAGRPSPEHAVANSAAIASELVTNAVRAGSSRIELSLALDGAQLRIEVADDAPGSVLPGEAGPTDTRGRGLVVVGALARAWGVEAGPAGAKQVWAVVDVPGPGPATPAAARERLA